LSQFDYKGSRDVPVRCWLLGKGSPHGDQLLLLLVTYGNGSSLAKKLEFIKIVLVTAACFKTPRAPDNYVFQGLFPISGTVVSIVGQAELRRPWGIAESGANQRKRCFLSGDSLFQLCVFHRRQHLRELRPRPIPRPDQIVAGQQSGRT